jgi:hypothetical protein
VSRFPGDGAPSGRLAHVVVCSQVRIYAVKKEDPLGRDLPAVSAFNNGVRLKRTKSAKPATKRS